MKLKFKNGQFRILVFADIHLSGREWKWTRAHLEAALNKSEPDLVVLLGDNITGRYPGVTQQKVEKAIHLIGDVFDAKKIPFTLVFGNHDHEGLGTMGYDEIRAKRFIMNEFEKHQFCIAVEGEKMTGVGNYNHLIYGSDDEKPLFNLWFMDSNPYADESEGGGYGYVHKDQLEWYERKSEELKKENGGKAVPSFLFQHIIVPEIYEMLTSHEKRVKGSVKGHGRHKDKFFTVNPLFIKDGSVREGPCPPDVKSEQFSSWLRAGDIIAAFFGHDHINDFSAECEGVRLHQVPSAGFYSYGYTQGSRVITLFENGLKSYKTEVIRCKDICDVRPRNPFVKKHGYHEWLTRWKPAVCGALIGAALISALLLII